MDTDGDGTLSLEEFRRGVAQLERTRGGIGGGGLQLASYEVGALFVSIVG
jgi:hypothetical protein